jgi:hypothetical protein
MISFNISAIDIILAIAVSILAILYLRKIQERFPEQLSYRSLIKNVKQQNPTFDFQKMYPKKFNTFNNLNDADDDNLVIQDL